MQGMFQMINQGIQQSPLAGPAGQGMLDMASMGLGGALGTHMGQDPGSFMSQGGRSMRADQTMAGIDWENPESIDQVAQQLMRAGRMEEALALSERSAAIQSKRNAALDVANEGIQEEAARKREHAKKVQAVSLARSRGDHEIAQAIQAGSITPEAYTAKLMKEKELHKLSAGSGLYDAEGNRIAFNPKSVTGESGRYDHSVAEFKAWDTLTSEGEESKAFGAKADALISQVQDVEDWESGVFADVEETLLTFLGMRDNPQYLRTQVTSMRNHEAIGMLPKGPASDRDIEIVMQGVPPRNAGKDEVIRFLEASSRVSKRLSEYNTMKADYVITGRAHEFQEDWDRKMERQARQEKIDNTPDWAIQELQNNPDLRDDFLEHYGWLPNG